MRDLFVLLYEMLIGPPQPPADTPLYRELIFPDVGGLTLLISLVVVVIYYYLLNHLLRIHWFSMWYHWLLTLAFTAGAAFLLADRYARQAEVTPDSYVTWFGLANLCWAVVFFALFSVALKWKSAQASRTPF